MEHKDNAEEVRRKLREKLESGVDSSQLSREEWEARLGPINWPPANEGEMADGWLVEPPDIEELKSLLDLKPWQLDRLGYWLDHVKQFTREGGPMTDGG